MLFAEYFRWLLQFVIKIRLTYLDSLALDDLSVSTLGVELKSVGVKFQMFLLPRLKEWSTELQHLAFDYTVRRSDYKPTTIDPAINQSTKRCS